MHIVPHSINILNFLQTHFKLQDLPDIFYIKLAVQLAKLHLTSTKFAQKLVYALCGV